MESVHNKLERVRKPRVHIKYDVETEGGLVQKDLPFVVGVLGDYSGNGVTASDKKPLKERKFVQIDPDNFDDVMKRIAPKLNLNVKNTLANDDTEMAVELEFNQFEDFEPGRIIEQVEPLQKLLEVRNHLRDLLTKCDRSEGLENILENVLSNTENLESLVKELGQQED